jgi:hypothetical protein
MEKERVAHYAGRLFFIMRCLVSFRLAPIADDKDCRVFVRSPANKIGRTVSRMDAQCLQRQIELSQNLAKREHNHVPAVAKAPRQPCANAIAVFIAERS